MVPFKVKFNPSQSIFDQVCFAAIKSILAGELKAGEAFPSVRVLALDLKIHPNTAHKVVQHLIQELGVDARHFRPVAQYNRFTTRRDWQRRGRAFSRRHWTILDSVARLSALIDEACKAGGKQDRRRVLEALPQLGRVVFDRDRVQVDDAEDRRIAPVLPLDVLANRPDVITEVLATGGLDA